ncbi:MAG: DMT family transporter [Thermodesulfobacteriota bacterium]
MIQTNYLQHMQNTVKSQAVQQNSTARGTAIALTGVFVLSFDALLIRLTGAGSWDILFWRGLLMGLSLGIVSSWSSKRFFLQTLRSQGKAAFASGTMFGLSGAGFVLSIMHTHVANTVLIFSTAPLFAALFTWIFLQERIGARTWLAILAVILGVALVFKGSLAEANLSGDFFALAAAMTVGGNFTLLRRNPGLDRAPLVAWGGFISAALALFWSAPLSLQPQSYLVLALMGLLQMPLALLLLAVATRRLTAPEVSMVLLLEAVLGPFWVWLALGETPPEATWLGGTIILGTLGLYFASLLRRNH